jgi:hypothetical protein
METISQFHNLVVCRGMCNGREKGWEISGKLLLIIPFAYYGSFFALVCGTLSNPIIMASNFDSLSMLLLWHLTHFISSSFLRKALRIKDQYLEVLFVAYCCT